MSEIIKNFYSEVRGKIPDSVIDKKIKDFSENSDIEKEFEYWIENHKYVGGNCVNINGYTAESLASMSKYIDGEGAFSMMMQLRKDPEKAIKRINDGFKYL